ncbi:uncharacterized protein A4U43_C02F840 [Asparagus officinalis]|uniref:Uncharacterized protein n=1 Tax=Asparagus officinalis TaxID=4686 RepID=A0A5P1FGN9_ASPOF|nr:uncharacterized protein A4U43_C02F840 [Asparagus officinalis]
MDSSTYDALSQVLGRQQSENGDYFDPSTSVLVQQYVGASNGRTMRRVTDASWGAAAERTGWRRPTCSLPSGARAKGKQESMATRSVGGAIPPASVIITQQEIVSDDGFGGTAASNHCFGGATPSIFAIPQRRQPPPQRATAYDGFGGSTVTNIMPAVPAQGATASTISQQRGGADDRSGGATTAGVFGVSEGEAAEAANDGDMSSASSWLEEILQDDATEQQHNLAFDAQNQELPVGIFESRFSSSSIYRYRRFGVSSSSGDAPQEQSNTEIEQTTPEEIRRNKRKQQNREAQ